MGPSEAEMENITGVTPSSGACFANSFALRRSVLFRETFFWGRMPILVCPNALDGGPAGGGKLGIESSSSIVAISKRSIDFIGCRLFLRRSSLCSESASCISSSASSKVFSARIGLWNAAVEPSLWPDIFESFERPGGSPGGISPFERAPLIGPTESLSSKVEPLSEEMRLCSQKVGRRKRIVAMLSLRAALKPRVGMCSPTASGRTRSKPPKPTRLLEPLEPTEELEPPPPPPAGGDSSPSSVD